MLVDMSWDDDGDECGMLCLSQLVEECISLPCINLTRLWKLATYESSITSEATEDVRKKMKLSRKRILMKEK